MAGRGLSADNLDVLGVASQAESFTGAELAEMVRRALEDNVRLEATGAKSDC